MSESEAGESEVIGYNKQMYGDPKKFAKRAPWDMGEPQPEVVDLVRSRAIRGEVLDIGCGTGEIVIYLASEGFSVTGLDAVPEAIQQAKERAAERGVTATFAVADATDLSAYADRFDTVVDSGLFHVLDAEQRRKYATTLHAACRPGGRVFVLAFSAEGREVVKARMAAIGVPQQVTSRMSPLAPDDLRAAFGPLWEEESIRDSAIRVRFPGDASTSDLPAMFAVFRRP
ncbi:class I SAM-dependent methyltransferase [Streptomyces sp. JJ38]|uniref:class I SAM-dependent methyltransferase n=1 Tax=Streptomyces sp. JJ38 TaxID=2738128 RepID=UPI001C56963A|nr:class I SAM-dependent methyltransferase [Streptomyces sp. JJ38]MBW1599257.1 class I SAM-dependent methyltransferase [Streptomyces sp. JJ38]